MHTFHGNLLIGGMAIRDLDGVLEEGTTDVPQAWRGKFETSPQFSEALQIGRQYLLELDDGRNREVVLTEIDAGSENSLVCEFAACRGPVKPK